MEYTISWLERKTTSTGKEKIDATLVSADGQSVEATIWQDFPNFKEIMNGAKVVGDLKPASDPKYKPSLNAPKSPVAQRNSNFKAQVIEKAVERKESFIKASQATKEESIRISSAQRDAVLMTTTFYRERIINDPIISELEMESILRKKIIEWRDWFLTSREFNDVIPFE